MLKPFASNLQPLFDFLTTKTPEAWLNEAIRQLPTLLLDHAHCERKAATMALNLISKYPEKKDMIPLMSFLAREELLHFEKVLALMRQRNINYELLKPSNYAKALHQGIRLKNKDQTLVDQLIIGAIIEARSCERFHALIPCLADEELAKFYANLVKSEARHFEVYLSLAKRYEENLNERIDFFLNIESDYILSDDPLFRFHSGVLKKNLPDSL